MSHSRKAKDCELLPRGKDAAPECDILVIGAGVVGVTTSYALARRGLSVALVDREQEPGLGTSFANGGQLSYAYTDALAHPALLRRMPGMLLGLDPAFRLRPSLDPAFLRWGLRFLRQCTDTQFRSNTLAALRLGLESQQAMHDLLARHDLSFDHVKAGKMQIYRSAEALAHARSVTAIKRSVGVEQHLLSPSQSVEVEPALAAAGPFAGALWTPGDEAGDPYAFCRAMLELLRTTYGVRVEMGFAAQTLSERPSGIIAADARGRTISARRLVVCMGADAPAFLARHGVRVPIQPMKGYSFTAPPGAHAPAVSITDAARKLVFCRLGGAVRVAGVAELGVHDSRVDKRRLMALVTSASQAMPKAADYTRIRDGWAGLRPMTPNSLPIISRAGRDIFLNLGHGMLGWTFAMGSAERAAEMVAPGRTEADEDRRAT